MSPLASLTAFAFSALLSVPVFAQKMDNNDAAALKQLVQANLNEVEAGKLGASNAPGPTRARSGQPRVRGRPGHRRGFFFCARAVRLALRALAMLRPPGAPAALGPAVFLFGISSAPPIPQPKEVFFARAWIDLAAA